MTHGMIRAMCQVYTREDKWEWGSESVERNKEKKEKKEGNRRKKEREKERKKRKGRRKEDLRLLPLIYRRSDSRSSLGQELKSVYSMRATVQEVEILPTLVYFYPKGCLA